MPRVVHDLHEQVGTLGESTAGVRDVLRALERRLKSALFEVQLLLASVDVFHVTSAGSVTVGFGSHPVPPSPFAVGSAASVVEGFD